MRLMTWEKYFYKELLKSALGFLIIFYGLYVLIDYSSHLSGTHYHHSKMGLGEFFIHYACEFSARADILIPFALLIGTIFTLTSLNTRYELVALLAGGYSLHRLLYPYIIAGLAGVALLYFNNEFLLPSAMKRLNRLDEKYAYKKGVSDTRAHHVTLDDGSLMIYRAFNPNDKTFLEVYWIPSFNEVWRMEILDPLMETPQGSFVDHFIRKDEKLTYDTSFLTYPFAKMKIYKKKLTDSLSTPEELSISALITQAPQEETALESEKAARTLTALYRKLAMPWLALLAVIGPAPFCLRFSRTLPVFFLFTGAIFGLVAIYLLFDAAQVLGERQVIAPSLAIFVPLGFFISVFLYRLVHIRT